MSRASARGGTRGGSCGERSAPSTGHDLARGRRGDGQEGRQRDQAQSIPVATRLCALEDGECECLCFARNVSGDQDRGAELPERTAERQKRSGEDPAPRERKGDAPKRAKLGVTEGASDTEKP